MSGIAPFLKMEIIVEPGYTVSLEQGILHHFLIIFLLTLPLSNVFSADEARGDPDNVSDLFAIWYTDSLSRKKSYTKNKN